MPGRTPGLNRIALRRVFAPDGGGGPHPGFDTLAELYAFGLSDDPTVDNRLVGSYFNTYFAEDGSLSVNKTTPELTTDLGRTPLVTRRYPADGGFTVNHRELRTTYPTVLIGGSTERYLLIRDSDDAELTYLTFFADVDQLGDGSRQSRVLWRMAAASGSNSDFFRNSDGQIYDDCMMYDSASIRRTFQQTLRYRNGSNMANGAGTSWLVTAPGTTLFAETEMVALQAIIDAQNPGAGQIEGHWLVRASSLAGGPQSVVAFFHDQALFVVDTNINGDLDVQGLATLLDLEIVNDILVGGNVDVDGDLTVTGAVLANGGLSVNGTAQFFDPAAFDDDVTVVGDLTLTGALLANGGLSVNGTAQFFDPAAFDDDVTVAGEVSQLGGPIPASGIAVGVDFLATGVHTISLPTRAGKLAMASLSRFVVTARTGAATGNLTYKVGNNAGHDNMIAAGTTAAAAGFNSTPVGGTVGGASTGGMPDMTTDQLVFEITGALGGASVLSGYFFLSIWYVDP